MTWIPPNLRSTGYRVPSDVYNTEIIGNLQHLSTHAHSGAAGDGAAMTVPRPILFQAEVANTAAAIVLHSENVIGNAFGNNGIYHGFVYFLLQNNSGVVRTFALALVYGAGSVPLTSAALGSGANLYQMWTEFILSVRGAPNSQQIMIRSQIWDRVAAGTPITTIADQRSVQNTLAIDSTALQLLQITMTMGAAHADLRFTTLGGAVWGPIYGP